MAAGGHRIDREILRGLMQPSFLQWMVRVLGDWCLAIGPIALFAVSRHPAAFVFAVVMSGIAQHRLALMAHEGSHYRASRNKTFNDLLTGFFALWPFGNPVRGYRRFHFDHHRYLNTEGDPELHHKQMSSPAWNLPLQKRHILKYFIQDICFLHVKELFQLMRNASPAVNWVDRALPTLFWIVVLTTLALTGAWWILAIWFLGTAVVFWPIFRLRIWTEHIGTHDVHRIHAPWWVRGILLPHNTWYHYEHHHFPQVPCWNLPRIRELLGESPEIYPMFDVIRSYHGAPEIGSGMPTREIGETLPKFDKRRCADVPADWESGRLTGQGAGTGGRAVFHTDEDVRNHAPKFLEQASSSPATDSSRVPVCAGSQDV